MEKTAAEMGGGGPPVSSRWNPTKEQISILENLYRQGVRTPSADQIQQITSRLKAYGHIEGKNVFYWFQNHKARQRQKQKQHSTFPLFNHFLHFNPNSPFPPPSGSYRNTLVIHTICQFNYTIFFLMKNIQISYFYFCLEPSLPSQNLHLSN